MEDYQLVTQYHFLPAALSAEPEAWELCGPESLPPFSILDIRGTQVKFRRKKEKSRSHSFGPPEAGVEGPWTTRWEMTASSAVS